MRENPPLVVINRTKGKLPRLPFKRLAGSILGHQLSLELVFVQPSESRTLNRRYRQKDKPANVLSFLLSPKQGILILCPAQARRETKTFGLKEREFLGYLFIHGLLHLKGRRHGSTMEDEEKRLCKKFLHAQPF